MSRPWMHCLASVLVLELALVSLLQGLPPATAQGTPPEAKARPAMQHFEDSPLARELRALVQNEGTGAALDQMVRYLEEGRLTKNELHPLGHVIGSSALERYATPEAALHSCRITAAYSCFHGVAMALVYDRDLSLTEVAALCRRQSEGEDPNCAHGLGHAAAFLLEDDMGKVLEICDAFTSVEAREGCAGGAFSQARVSPIHRIDVGEKYVADLWGTCGTVAPRYREVCLRFWVTVVARALREDWPALGSLCASIPEGRVACWRGVGAVIQGDMQRDLRVAIPLCRTLHEGADHCVTGAMDMDTTQLDTSIMATECQAMRDDEAYAYCGEMLGVSALGARARSDLLRLCADLRTAAAAERCTDAVSSRYPAR